MESESSTIVVFLSVVFLSLLYGFFNSALAAIVRSRSSQLTPEGQQPSRAALNALRILDRAEHYALVAQTGKFLSGMLLGVCLVELLRGSDLYRLSAAISQDYRLFVYSILLVLGATTLSILALTSVQIFKALSSANPERALMRISYLLYLAEMLLRPLVLLLQLLVSNFLQRFKIPEARERELPVSTEEISEIVERSTLAGEMEQDDGELLQGVVSFSDTTVREVMTPRTDIVAVNMQASLDEIVNVFIGEGLSRLLVIGEDLDDVRGVILVKDLIPLLRSRPESFDIKRYLRRPHYVMENHPVDEVLKYFKLHANHFAVVHDEHGGTAGIVTMEDLIEEIVGDIFDEYDEPELEKQVYRAKNGDLLVDGSMSLEDLNDEYELELPEGEYDTVAGFLIAQLGRIPRKGESVDYNGVTIAVEQRQQNRITLLRLVGVPEKSDASSNAA